MSRYIDADALINRLDVVDYGMKLPKAVVGLTKALLDDAPSIDIVPCKECRYCKKKRGTFKGEPITFYRCEENNRDVESDDFCSYGERSEP